MANDVSFDIIPPRQWFPELTESPVIIAGPCSAETEEQLLSTAAKLCEIKRVKIFRAGIWKPRTRPNTFEGVGEKGLAWLQKVKQQYGLLTATEVAYGKHVELALRYGVDILWVGARSSANPFLVQELADAVRGHDVPVMVKNPLNPDINLWIGALERFNQAGIKKLAAIHRGFFPFEKTSLRNIPKWEVPVELKIRFPHLPVFSDPSHISGDRKHIPTVAQKALSLNFDGLMIESHIAPHKALSDAQQQITPDALLQLLQKLQVAHTTSDSAEFTNLLEQYREKIDSIDTQLLELLAQRMDIVTQIGQYKQEHNVTILQLKRWLQIVNSRCEMGHKLGLKQSFIKQILDVVHKESILQQTEIIKNGKKSLSNNC